MPNASAGMRSRERRVSASACLESPSRSHRTQLALLYMQMFELSNMQPSPTLVRPGKGVVSWLASELSSGLILERDSL